MLKSSPQIIKLPKSDAKGWEPYVIQGKAKIACLSDIHVPYHCTKALKCAVNELKRRKPTHLLLNGDSLDFYGISRFEKDPSSRDPISEIKLLSRLLRYFDQEFPKAQKILKLGNHDERWDKWLWANAPMLYKIEAIRFPGVLGIVYGQALGHKTYDISEFGWTVIDNKRPILAGHLPIFHGHEFHAGSPVNPARGAYLKTKHTVLIGHHHNTSSHTEPNLWGSETVAWSQGCLCELHPSYMPVNKWNHGFAFITVDRDNKFNVDNLRITRDGKVRS